MVDNIDPVAALTVARVASWVLNGKKLRSVLLKSFLKPSPKTKVLSNRTFSQTGDAEDPQYPGGHP